MRLLFTWLRKSLPWIWSRPDELMLQFGADGELLVARARAVLCALLLLLPLTQMLGHGSGAMALVGLAVGLFLNLMAQLWLALASRKRGFAWLPFATSSYDVTAITVILALLSLSDRVLGVNGTAGWAFYLLVIGATALRNDGRLTSYVGALAIGQYALLSALLLFSATSADQLISAEYGTASDAGVLHRLLLLLLMTLLTGVIAYRIQRLIERSGNDGLTGLPNRSWLLQRMPGLLDELRHDGGSLTLALLDIDNFRRVNEAVGHLEGDRAIRHLASVLRTVLHEHEHLVRLGGQEFVLLLRSPIGAAWERVDRIRRTLSKQPFVCERHQDSFHLTFSAGLASFPQDGTATAGLLRNADHRLKSAKRSGGNRVLTRDS